MVEFTNKSTLRSKKVKKKKKVTYESSYGIYEVQELTLNAFKSGIFLIKAKKGKERSQNIISKRYASKVNNSSCTSKSR